MNKQRRKQVARVVAILSELDTKKPVCDYCNTIDSANELLQDVIDDEQFALDNMPDNLLFSQRYDDMNDGLMDLEGALSDLEISSERIRERGKFHGSDTKSVRDAIDVLRKISKQQ